MKFSIITPFNRGIEQLRDNLESIREQRLRIYLDEVDKAEGFTRTERLMNMLGAENMGKVSELIRSGDLDGVEALARIKGVDDLWPLLTFDGLGNIIAVTDKSELMAGAARVTGPSDRENEEEREEGSSDNESDEENEIRPFVYVPYRDFELIIVEDHPEEDISALVDEYKDIFDIKVLSLEDATGVAAARNKGIEEAEGEYIMFVDSDDYLFPRALYFMDKASHTAANPDIIYGMKVWTWYSRNGFIATFNKQQQEEENNAQADDSTDDSAADEAREREERMKSELSEQEFIEYRRKNAASRLISRRKGIRNVSALGISYKRTLLMENNIRFPEQFRYYSDFPFLCLALEKATTFRKNYRSWYIKRKHADSINFPSLAQEKSENRFPELLESYAYTKKILKPDGIIRQKADLKFIGYYTGYFVTRLRRSENDYWREERFDACSELVKDIPVPTLKLLSHYKRSLIKLLVKGDAKKTYRRVSFKLALKKLWKCMTSRTMLVQSFYVHVFLKKPVKKEYIMFECFFGRSYGDNPRALYEYISKTFPGKYTCIWSMAKTHGNNIPYKHKTVKRLGLRYGYYLARSKFFVFNTKQAWMRKREGQVFLETWHGTPLKKLAFDMEDNFSASPGYKKHIYSKTRSWDYLVAANSFSSEVFKRCFMFENKMLEYGYPRNDVLHGPDRDERAAEIRKKLGIPEDKKTILYAPTWRDDEYYGAGEYKFTLRLDLNLLREKLGEDYVVLLRTHYYIADKLDVTGLDGFAYNLSKYPDIADIYLISDICITDYSSVFFDYAGLRRPMLFYTYDIDKYRDMLRGFYFDMESTVPGPLLYTSEEVVDAILHIDEVSAKFKEKYDAFYERFCAWEDGRACANIYEEVFVRGEAERALAAERAELERTELEREQQEKEDMIE